MHCSYFCRNNIKIRECFLPTLKSSLWTRLNLRNQNLQTIYVTVRIGIRNFPWSQTDPTLLSFNLEIPEVWRISLVTFSFIIIRRQVSRLTPAMKLSFSPFRPVTKYSKPSKMWSVCLSKWSNQNHAPPRLLLLVFLTRSSSQQGNGRIYI